MTDVILFNQYFTASKESNEKFVCSMPLNLLYLSTYIDSKGISCKVHELGAYYYEENIDEGDRIRFGKSDDEIKKIILEENPKIIGISCMYSRHYVDIVTLAAFIKKVNKDVIVVTGGNHASSFPEFVLNSSEVDFVVMGEGELTFHELIESVIQNKKDFSQILGIAYRKNEKNVINPPRPLIKDLDTLPLPNYSLINPENYANRLALRSPYVLRFPYIGIMSSRGCPSKCKFCTVKAVWGRSWRGKSAKIVVDEIEELVNKYKIKEIAFLDDSVSSNKKRWEDICDEIINRKIDIRWTTPNGIAHWTLDKPLLKKMKEAGCYRITFGIESGDIETRKYIRKAYDLNKAKELIQYANKIGLWTIATPILGFPHETREQMENTINFAITSGMDFAAFYLLNPMPTSDVYEDFVKEKLVNYEEIFNKKGFSVNEYESMFKELSEQGAPTTLFTPEELKKIHFYAYRKFFIRRAISFLNPTRIIRKIHSFEDFQYATRLINTGFFLLIKSIYKKTTKSLLYD